jgi:hypothetical protein
MAKIALSWPQRAIIFRFHHEIGAHVEHRAFICRLGWRLAFLGSLLGLGLGLPGGVAEARPWKPSATAQASNYLSIIDNRDRHDMKMLLWMAPPMTANSAARRILSQYVILGVVRARSTALGSFSFGPIPPLAVTDASGHLLPPLAGEDIPPAVAGAVVAMGSVFAQALGPFGKGFHWFIFKADGVDACRPGGLRIPFAGEVYTYDTPVPGCEPAL